MPFVGSSSGNSEDVSSGAAVGELRAEHSDDGVSLFAAVVVGLMNAVEPEEQL